MTSDSNKRMGSPHAVTGKDPPRAQREEGPGPQTLWSRASQHACPLGAVAQAPRPPQHSCVLSGTRHRPTWLAALRGAWCVCAGYRGLSCGSSGALASPAGGKGSPTSPRSQLPKPRLPPEGRTHRLQEERGDVTRGGSVLGLAHLHRPPTSCVTLGQL